MALPTPGAPGVGGLVSFNRICVSMLSTHGEFLQSLGDLSDTSTSPSIAVRTLNRLLPALKQERQSQGNGSASLIYVDVGPDPNLAGARLIAVAPVRMTLSALGAHRKNWEYLSRQISHKVKFRLVSSFNYEDMIDRSSLYCSSVPALLECRTKGPFDLCFSFSEECNRLKTDDNLLVARYAVAGQNPVDMWFNFELTRAKHNSLSDIISATNWVQPPEEGFITSPEITKEEFMHLMSIPSQRGWKEVAVKVDGDKTHPCLADTVLIKDNRTGKYIKVFLHNKTPLILLCFEDGGLIVDTDELPFSSSRSQFAQDLTVKFAEAYGDSVFDEDKKHLLAQAAIKGYDKTKAENIPNTLFDSYIEDMEDPYIEPGNLEDHNLDFKRGSAEQLIEQVTMFVHAIWHQIAASRKNIEQLDVNFEAATEEAPMSLALDDESYSSYYGSESFSFLFNEGMVAHDIRSKLRGSTSSIADYQAILDHIIRENNCVGWTWEYNDGAYNQASSYDMTAARVTVSVSKPSEHEILQRQRELVAWLQDRGFQVDLETFFG
jgi:hypothetical protein